MKRQLWAKAPRNEIAHEINEKFQEHLRRMESSGYAAMIQESYNAYYNFSEEGGFGLHVSRDRSSAKVKANHYKNLIQRVHQMVTNAKLSYTPRARNSDADSQLQADFSRGLLESIEDDKNLNEYTAELVEAGLVCFESYMYAPWDKSQGIEITKDETGIPMMTGDQAFYNLTAFDVAKHPTLKKSPYFIVRVEVSKYDLAAEYPKHADEIVAMSSGRNSAEADRIISPFDTPEQDPEDTIYKYVLLHDRTQSLPKGRHTEIVGDVVLLDRALSYKTIPVVRFTPSDVFGSTGGDSPASSLLSLQEPMDKLWSAVTGNNLTAAKSNVWSRTAIDVQQISEGYNNIVSAEKPEVLNLAGSSPETYKLIESYQNQLELLSGVNKSARGNPDSAVSTAAGQALMLAQAIEFVSDTQRQYARAASELATIIIHNFQVFSTEPRLAYIGGKSRASYVKQFTNKDLNAVDRVSVDIGNPLTQTISGRYTLATEWVQAGVIKDPAKLNEFLRTGQLDSLTEDQFKDSILIRNENEELRKGEKPIVALYDLHPQHILEHKALAADPAFRYNPQLMKALNDHIQEHIDAQKAMPPDLAAILGIPPLPSQQQPQGASAPPPPEMIGPEVNGQPLPTIPEEAPLESQEAYAQATEPFMSPEIEEGVM